MQVSNWITPNGINENHTKQKTVEQIKIVHGVLTKKKNGGKNAGL